MNSMSQFWPSYNVGSPLRVRYSEIFSRGLEYKRGSNHIKPKYITGMSYLSGIYAVHRHRIIPSISIK
jgi:hypothetical protein